MVRYPSSLIGEPSVTGTLPVVDAERICLGCAWEDVGSLLAEKPRPNVEEVLPARMLCARIGPFVTR
jgi:hypothetical protein